MIISFAWTTLAVIANHYDPPGKTETRRDWSPKTIAQFQKLIGNTVDAWDKSPRFFGKHFGTIVVRDVIAEEYSNTIPDEAWQKEGFDRLTAIGRGFSAKWFAEDTWRHWIEPVEHEGELRAWTQTVLVFELADLNEYGHKLWLEAVETHGDKLFQRAPVPALEGLPEGWRAARRSSTSSATAATDFEPSGAKWRGR